jgi:hypothetical protein
VTSELITFIERAIKEQELPYSVTSQDGGFTLELSTKATEYLRKVKPPEAFRLTAILTEKEGSKPTIHLVEELYRLNSVSDETYEFGDELPFYDAVGVVETERVSSGDEWKLFKARRWLVSLLEFKEYKFKEPQRTRPRAALLVIGVVVALALLAAAFSGIAGSMNTGAFSGQEEIIDDPDSVSSDEVLGNFYK